MNFRPVGTGAVSHKVLGGDQVNMWSKYSNQIAFLDFDFLSRYHWFRHTRLGLEISVA